MTSAQLTALSFPPKDGCLLVSIWDLTWRIVVASDL